MQNKFKMSVDKISLIYKVGYKRKAYDIGMMEWNMYDEKYCSNMWQSSRMGTYKYNYEFRETGNKEGTIYVGIEQISFRDIIECKRKIKVEYNPNKTEFPRMVRRMLDELGAVLVNIKSVDLALDFPDLKIDDVRYKSKGHKMIYYGDSDKTYTIRPKGEGRIKIYDKTKERAKLGIEIKQTLRVEITLKNVNWCKEKEIECLDVEGIIKYTDWLKEISVRRKIPVIPQTPMEKKEQYNEIILYLLNNVEQEISENAINMMSRNHRTKYRKLMNHSEFEEIEIDWLAFYQEVSKLVILCL